MHADHYDVKMPCHLILSKLAEKCPSAVLAGMSAFICFCFLSFVLCCDVVIYIIQHYNVGCVVYLLSFSVLLLTNIFGDHRINIFTCECHILIYFLYYALKIYHFINVFVVAAMTFLHMFFLIQC